MSDPPTPVAPFSGGPSGFGRQLIVAAAIGLLAPFTGLAWPFAIATGIVIGSSEVERAHGGTTSRSTRLLRAVAVTGGVFAMFVAGAIVGAFVGFFVAALAVFSERIGAAGPPTDRNLARILLLIGGAVGWIVLGEVLGIHLSVRFGS